MKVGFHLVHGFTLGYTPWKTGHLRPESAFLRRELAETRALDLNSIVKEDVALLERTTLQKVRLEMELDPGLHSVEGDPTALSHALMNWACPWFTAP